MASESSFDVVSRVDSQELDNALNQTRKEIENRFDFKNSKTEINFDGKAITLISDDELKMRNVVDVLKTKAVRRGIDVKAFDFGAVEPAAGGTVRQVVNIRSGIPKEQSRPLLAEIKNLKLKVNAQYQDDHIRVSAKSKDDLQKVIVALRSLEFELPLQFVNYR
ncbi:MAG: YajQ family cyclic di-GMP-binding protein [Candidatus Eremiobacteraeota bacterium]|nr:YajQ family cyclic di-GMP-binding protein [Candidatus Eremiobacteraeota bacterium]